MSRHELHPFPLRVWHWANTVLIIALIITGIQLRAPDVQFLYGYRSAVLLHKFTGYLMTLSFIFWLVYSLATGSLLKYYVLRPRDVKGVMAQAQYYVFGVFKGRPNPFPATPEEKFNPLQKLAYLSIMLFFTPVIVITGILFSDILFFRSVIDSIGGIRAVDAVHVIVAYVFVDYLVAHIYMSTLGKTPLSHVKEMFTGHEDEE